MLIKLASAVYLMYIGPVGYGLFLFSLVLLLLCLWFDLDNTSCKRRTGSGGCSILGLHSFFTRFSLLKIGTELNVIKC